MALRCLDLMLGDWVKMYNGKGEYIDDTRVDINTLYTICQEGQNVLRLEPIPLTPEILKKNGFQVTHNVSSSANKNMWWLEQLCLCEHHDKKKYPCFWISIGSDADIKYVHELQHCLKLVGIEQKIVL